MFKRYFQARACKGGRHVPPERGINWGALVVRARCRHCGTPIRVIKDEVWVVDAGDGAPD